MTKTILLAATALALSAGAASARTASATPWHILTPDGPALTGRIANAESVRRDVVAAVNAAASASEAQAAKLTPVGDEVWLASTLGGQTQYFRPSDGRTVHCRQADMVAMVMVQRSPADACTVSAKTGGP